MAFNYVRTGPFSLVKVVDDDPGYLRLVFDDLNNEGYPNVRSLRKGGNWPGYFADLLREKANKLIGEKVYVVTSHTTRPWPTDEWLCDIEPAVSVVIKSGLKKFVSAADGKSDLLQFLSYSPDGGNLCLVDYSLVQNFFAGEDEFEDFSINLAKGFPSSWRSPKHQRHISDGIKRIRIKGNDNLSQRNGYRVVVAELFSDGGVAYYVAMEVDKKLDSDFPSNREIKAFVSKRNELLPLYDQEKIQEVIKRAFDKDYEDDEEIVLKPPQETDRLYLQCPYSEKDDCKKLGGVWDSTKKKWFVPAGVDKTKFQKWIKES